MTDDSPAGGVSRIHAFSRFPKREERKGEGGEGQRGRRPESCRQKARSLQRLLEHKQNLPEDVQIEMRARAEALQKEHRRRVKELKRQKFVRAKKALYSKLKFYELKKVQRRLQQTRKQLVELLSQQQQQQQAGAAGRSKSSYKKKRAGGEDMREKNDKMVTSQVAELQQQLRLHLEDLNYIRLYPADEPYVSLFPAQDSEESQQKRLAMRLRIRELMLKSRMDDEGNENDDAGGDDMFVEAPQQEREASSALDPFENAVTLSDEEAPAPSKEAHRQPRDYFSKYQERINIENHHGGEKRVMGREGTPHTRRGEPSGTSRPSGINGNCQHTAGGGARPREKQGKAFKEGDGKERMKKGREDGGASHARRTEGKADTSSAPQKKEVPTRIGISKHKPANQHLLFDSDEE